MDGLDKRQNRPKVRQSIAHLPLAARLNATDKQNATIDLSAARKNQQSQSLQSKRRARGKSLGPGGLEALTETDGNVTKDIPIFQPRSILKPAIPLTPPKKIPTFDELRQQSTSKKRTSARKNQEALLIDFSTPGSSKNATTDPNQTKSQNIFDPFSPIMAINGEEENGGDNDGGEEELERLRLKQKKAVLEQRAARRKSMANRRVSFAPEATLHTWSVMELAEDSTTSSASNSTRRQSSITAEQTLPRIPQSPAVVSDPIDPPSTPPRQTDEQTTAQTSPARQRDLHQKKRRRSSAMSAHTDVSDGDVFSSSPSGDVVTESSPIRVDESMASDSDSDGDTAMSIDEMTQNTVQSQYSDSITHSSLEDRLHQAATQAGTRGIEYDEHGDDLSMDIANDTVTHAFQPWAHGRQQNLMQDQENVNPFSPVERAHQIQTAMEQGDEDVTQGMTMEMTRAVGGILEEDSPLRNSRRKSATSRRKSGVGKRQSMGAETSYGDETMDFTTVAGGIVSGQTQEMDHVSDESDEEMTMEFTTAVGGVKNASNKRESLQSSLDYDNETMDMTAAVGGILGPIEEQTEPQSDYGDERTMAMDMTRAVGQILPGSAKKSPVSHMKGEVENDNTALNPSANGTSSLQVDEQIIHSTPRQLASVASETGSPSLALKTRSSGRIRSARNSQSTTPKSSAAGTPQRSASIKKQETPTKQLTPVPSRAKTPERTPVVKNITPRSVSPKKLFQAEIQAKLSPATANEPPNRQKDLLFAQDELTGRQTPRVILHAPKPHQHMRRRSSGVGIDKEGLGSPSVTQLLSRRSSITNAASEFKLESMPTSRLRFEHPKQIEQEVDAERADDERRESGRFVMAQEANGSQEENTTMQLKEMIESMSPKKKPAGRVKGRKSLAVGSARGLLGKRPVELDDEGEESESTPKRLKAVSRDNSPVKKIHLPKPPSKEETTGRLTRAERKALENTLDREHTPALRESSAQSKSVESPQQPSRFRDIAHDSSAERPPSFEDKLDNVVSAIDVSIEHPPASKKIAEEDKVSLQEFLNMTNIHFIELNTTKRRHTMAQAMGNDVAQNEDARSNSTGARFVAATTTIPLLELYQHATRELKSYISSGRKIIRSIEAETLNEQPPLFREYIEARPDVKLVMDNQFRNSKTNARLQSKEGWYTWRSQLVDSLQNGLQNIANDLKDDFAIVNEQADAVAIVVPALEERRLMLSNELTSMQQRLEDVASVDQSALKATRKGLKTIDQELRAKTEMLETLRHQMQEKEETLSQATELKTEMQEQIAEASRVLEENRGWSTKDVTAVKDKALSIRKQSGWSLVSAEEDLEDTNEFGVALTLCYKDVLRLFFYPSVYQTASNGSHRRSGRASKSMSGPTAPISLTYSPLQEDDTATPQLSTEKRFFVQFVQSQLHALSVMPKGPDSAKTVLKTVSAGWDLACQVSEEIRILNSAGITRVAIQGDEKLAVKLMLMLEDKSRVDIQFDVGVTISDHHAISLSASILASAIYGPITKLLDASKSRKVQTALNKMIESKPLGEGAWLRVIQGFQDWHTTQLQNQATKQTKKIQSSPTSIKPTTVERSTTPPTLPAKASTAAVKRSPFTAKKASAIQKKTIPVPMSRQDKFRTSQRDQQHSTAAAMATTLPEKQQATVPPPTNPPPGKENVDPFTFAGDGTGTETTMAMGTGTAYYKAPAITPEMQEAMMQRTPIKRIGALRRSPI